MAPRPPSRDADDDFITTISDGDSVPAESESEPETKTSAGSRKRKRDGAGTNGDLKRRKKDHKSRHGTQEEPASGEDDDDRLRVKDDGAMDSEFEFEIGDVNQDIIEDFDAWDGSVPREENGRVKRGVDIDELVAKRRALKEQKTKQKSKRKLEDLNDEGSEEDSDVNDLEEGEDGDEDMENIPGADNTVPEESDDDELLAEDGFGMGASLAAELSEEDDNDEGGDSDSDDEAAEDDDSVASPMAHPDDMSADEEEDDPEERAREEAFFAPEPTKPQAKPKLSSSFQAMSLSRPILRGLAALNFSDPTPIQAKTIPVALLGKDVVGGAVTGSGKTGAFMIPILERLLYRPRKVPTTRVVILMPTRELAVQCYNVARKLASFTDITFAQIVGGLSLREQEGVLRRRPDVVIATTGRFIDHMRNSAAFAVDAIEILVLDEADRMLEDGFADELNEILTTIPRSRQTMLFSATMTSRVDQLIRVGLQKPVRLLVDAQRQTVGSLVQEFVRLRAGREDKRLAYLMQLVSTVYTSRCIIFFRQKKETHRVRIVFSLCDIRAAELHGSMSQEQRLAAVENFRAGTVTHLLATDVASRGLDIRGVESVLNYEAPQTHAIYLHRVGRTARMGRSGRACTLAAEEDRKVVREVVKGAKEQGAKVAGRTVDATAIDGWVERLEKLDDEVQAVLDDEKEARAMAQADMQVRKGENLIKHAEEIAARPKRTWFATESEKATAKKKGRAELNGEVNGRGPMVVGKKVSNKERKREALKRDRKEAGKLFKKGKEDRGTKRGGPKAAAAAAKSKTKNGRTEGKHKMKMHKGTRGRK